MSWRFYSEDDGYGGDIYHLRITINGENGTNCEYSHEFSEEPEWNGKTLSDNGEDVVELGSGNELIFPDHGNNAFNTSITVKLTSASIAAFKAAAAGIGPGLKAEWPSAAAAPAAPAASAAAAAGGRRRSSRSRRSTRRLHKHR